MCSLSDEFKRTKLFITIKTKQLALLKGSNIMATLFNGEELDWNCYNEGYNACESDTHGNPYEPETKKWYSWNKGWNAYTFEDAKQSNDPKKLDNLILNHSQHS